MGEDKRNVGVGRENERHLEVIWSSDGVPLKNERKFRDSQMKI